MHWGALIVACGLLATMVTGEPDRAKYQIHMDRAKAAMATADYGMALSEYTLAAGMRGRWLRRGARCRCGRHSLARLA